MSDKKSIRSEMKAALSQLTKPFYEDYSYQIAKNLYHQSEWIDAKVIGITISKQPEVDTYQIIRKAWELGKQVAVPKCHPQNKKLTFRILTEFSQLESVFYGLLEPVEALTTEVTPAEIDLLIVPGLAYNHQGYRIGFGGGYYDRFLQQYKGATASLAFHNQVIENMPVEVHDIPVSKIITDQGVINVQ